MILPMKALNKGSVLCAGISLCISVAAQTSLTPLPRASPVLVQGATYPADDHPITQESRTQGKEADGLFSKQFGQLLVKDVAHTLTAPANWDSGEWRQFGIAGAAILGTGLLLDRPVRDAVQRNRKHGPDRFITYAERFGSGYSFGVLGGFYVAGAFAGDARAMLVAQDGLASSLIATGMIAPALKFIVGRSRPNANKGSGDFHVFSRKHEAFPSGHATQAFAVATVIAAHYDDPWVRTISFGTAGLVGFARVYHDAHFTSDVLAGALLGTVVASSIVAYNDRQRSSKLTFLPTLAPGRAGMALLIRF
jgi:hypothetical protein